MSLVHWDKSVFSFHLKEILEDHNQGNPTALVGLGAILLGTTILPAAAKLGRPVLKSVIKSGISLYEESKSEVEAVMQLSQQENATPAKNNVPAESTNL